jgi:CHAD domain-containing protein
VVEEKPLELRSRYFDTPELRLLGSGITLRYRSGEKGVPPWTLKLPVDGDDTLRSEVHFKGDPGEPPGGALDLLRGVLTGAHVVPIGDIETSRRRFLLKDPAGAELAELVDDRVSILDDAGVRDTFREIEIESRGAGRQGLERMARVIQKAGARREQRSKISRALEALRGEAFAPQQRLAVSPGDPVELAVRPALSAALRRILLYDPHARLNEVEGVHGMRVGARRMRSVFRTFSGILDPEKEAPLVEGLRWMGRLLGVVRDMDVLLAHLTIESAGRPAAEPALTTIRKRHIVAQAALRDALDSQKYLDLICSLQAAAADDSLAAVSPGTCDRVLPQLVDRHWRRVRRAAGALGSDSPETDVHRVRILAKRCRYAAEMSAGFTNPRTGVQLRDFAAGLARTQNTLGEYQDAVTARDVLLAVASQHAEDGALNLEIGRLIEREDRRVAERLVQFLAAWPEVDRKKNLKWAKA